MTGDDRPAANDLLGVVLAGGKSSRMGRDKAGLEHPQGGSYLEFALGRMATVCANVVVSGETSVDHAKVTLADDRAHQGPIFGIQKSLRHAHQLGLAGCLVTPVDMPYLQSSDLMDLIDSWSGCRLPTCAVSDRTEPLVAIYPVDLLAAIDERIAAGRRSLFDWINQAGFRQVQLAAAACGNINTPEDLESI